MTTVVRYQWFGIHEMIDEVQRVASGPDFVLIGEWEATLAKQFADTQVRVASPAHPHVPTYAPTGSLQASGAPSTEYDGQTWTGSITYGGFSTGPNNPVDYAIYEMARGGIHDFFAGLPAFEHEYLDAITNFYDRGE